MHQGINEDFCRWVVPGPGCSVVFFLTDEKVADAGSGLDGLGAVSPQKAGIREYRMPSDLESILKLDVPIIVRIAERRMIVDDVVAFAPGTIVELPKSADEDLDVMVNNVPIGQGHAVKVGENFGVELTYVGDLRSRIAAMSGRQFSDDGEGILPDIGKPESAEAAESGDVVPVADAGVGSDDSELSNADLEAASEATARGSDAAA